MTSTERRSCDRFHGGTHGTFHAFAACLLLSFSAVSAEPSAAFNDGIDGTDPNFVTASLLEMSLGVLLEGGAIWR